MVLSRRLRVVVASHVDRRRAPWNGSAVAHEWRHDEGLKGRLHEEFPDDIQVLCHDGEPRRTNTKPEVCWVRVESRDDGIERAVIHVPEQDAAYLKAISSRSWGNLNAVYRGVLLNRPAALATVNESDRIAFVLAPGLEYPIQVSAQYLAERASWAIAPCTKCGFGEGLDPPTIMHRTRFPDALPDAELERFTSFCPFCGGTQLFSHRGRDVQVARKHWWNFS